MAGFLNFKLGANGFSGLYQVNGKGPWLTEYKASCSLPYGTYEVRDNGKKVGIWIRETFGHRVIAC